ncbi:MAG: alanine--glyoxylate aminotransferase family protein [Bacteroidetes bacterium]|nr:alanine--glyoxylate aminotransferase family protein [Bacteroidota bacterium]
MENTFKSFLAPSRILLGPGPATVNPRVLKALSQPTLGHLDPNVISMMDEIKAMLRNSFLTENEHTFVISAPGSVGMEFSFVNLIEPGEKVIICTNGYFGDRMKQVAERSGAEVVVVAGEWGKPLDIENLKITLKYNPDTKFVGFVSSETSTGVRNDTKALCEIAKQAGCITIVDAVTTLGATEFRVDEWGVDMAYSCSQKGLGSVPGMSPVTISPLAVEKIKNRKTPITSWFLDLNNVWPYWGSFEKRSYHHTAPVNSFYALHESLVILMEEGLENSWSRHTRNHLYLSDAMATLGMDFYVEAPYRLPQLNTILLKEGMDDAAIRKSLLLDYGIEVGAGLGAGFGKLWRIGLMGYGSNIENIDRLMNALKIIL